jgi:hypothetical protein
MAQPIARDTQDFARLMLRTLERLGQSGEWVSAREAFDRAVAEHPGHPYLDHIAAKPGRRIGLSATLERLRAAEFPSIERRKAGPRRNAPVLYRVAPAPVALELPLPHDAPASHPLVTRRRAAEAQSERATSARRLALTEPAARSPWRRRLLPRVAGASQGVESALRSLPPWWRHRLLPRVAGAAHGIETAARSLRHWWRGGVLPRVAGAAQGVESALRPLPLWWRYRLLPRVTGVAQGAESALRSLRPCWHRLRALGLTLAAGLARR